MNLLFEEKRRSIETAMSRDDGMSEQSYLDRAMADMAATLRAQAEMLSRQMAPAGSTVVAALPQRQSIDPTVPAAPPQAQAAAIGAPAASRIDDPEFERAILKMADREGWWHDDPDEIVAQFDMMLTKLFTLQEEYLRYCVRKGLDPAAALPSLASLDGALTSVANDIHAGPGPVAVAVPLDAPRIEDVRKPRATRCKDGRRF